MKKIFALLVIIAASKLVSAQSELITPFFNDLFQTSYLNPATNPDHSISIGLPGISSVQMQFIQNGFMLNKAIDGNTLSVQKILDNMSNQNMLYLNADIDILHFRIRVDDTSYWLGVRQRHNFSFFYPKELFELAIKGNAHLVGQHMNMDEFGLDANIYREYTAGMSRAVDDWYFGGRISFLNGLSSVYLNPDVLELHVLDDMFSHSFNTNAIFYSAGIPFDEDVDDKWVSDYLTRIKNPGFAIAFGSDYHVDEQWNLTFSVTDIGFIRWNDNTRNYQVNGMAEFKGLDILSDLLDGKDIAVGDAFDEIIDDLNGEEFEEAYTTWLNPRFSVAANYKLNEKTTLRAGLYGIYNRQFYPAFSVGAMHQFGKLFAVAANASVNQKSYTNLGLGFVMNPGPIQLYIMTDNFSTPLFAPASVTNVNFRFGINFVFRYHTIVETPVDL